MISIWLAAGVLAAAPTAAGGKRQWPQGQFVRLRTDEEQEQAEALLRRNNEALLALLM